MSNKTLSAIPHLALIQKIPLRLLIALSAILLFSSIQLINALFIKPCHQALKSQISILSNHDHRLMRLDSGRFFLGINDFKQTPLQIQFKAKESANFLLFRKGLDALGTQSTSHLKISIEGGETTYIQEDSKRQFIPLPKNSTVNLVLESLDPTPTKLVIDEIGLTNVNKIEKLNKLSMVFKLLFISAIGICIFWRLDRTQSATFGSIYFFLLPLVIHLSYLFLSFSPDWGRDLRVYFASGPLQEPPSCNLNYGLYMAKSILEGKGPLVCGMPHWCRMPGYGFILALAGNSSNLLQMAINAAFLQIALFALSIMFFFYSSLRIMPSSRAALITTVISLFPLGLHLTQIESMMPTVIVLLAAIGCLFAERVHQNRPISFRYHLLLHFGFALWFSLRTDILPAWAVVSLFLYGKNFRNWKYFLIPSTFCLAIGLSWALFKLPLTKEFSMTTDSIGISMMVGLWEIPHKFIWPISDGAYFNWMAQAHMPIGTKASSDFAVKEVFRFCLTYPIYTCSLFFHKFLFYAKTFGNMGPAMPWKSFLLIFPLILSFTTKYKRFQTFILSWPIFFNIPVFFLFYSSGGRFYIAPTLSLIIASFALLLDLEFYRKIIASWRKTAMISLLFIGVMGFGPMLDEYLIKNDKLRYWAPFLDPEKSTLNVVAQHDKF